MLNTVLSGAIVGFGAATGLMYQGLVVDPQVCLIFVYQQKLNVMSSFVCVRVLPSALD